MARAIDDVNKQLAIALFSFPFLSSPLLSSSLPLITPICFHLSGFQA